jgi:hypothetical protein
MQLQTSFAGIAGTKRSTAAGLVGPNACGSEWGEHGLWGTPPSPRSLQRKISDACYMRLIDDVTGRQDSTGKDPEGTRGTTLSPARPAHTPKHQLFGQATPGSLTTLRPTIRRHRCRSKLETNAEPVDNKEDSIGAA